MTWWWANLLTPGEGGEGGKVGVPLKWGNSELSFIVAAGLGFLLELVTGKSFWKSVRCEVVDPAQIPPQNSKKEHFFFIQIFSVLEPDDTPKSTYMV